MAIIKYRNPNYVEGGSELEYISVPIIASGPEEVYIGDTEPTNQEKIWVDTLSGVTKYKNGSEWINLISEYILPASTSSKLGGIKVGYTTSGKNYKVQLDSSNNAYVNVPWTSATATSSSSGLMSSTDKSKLDKTITPTILNTVTTLTSMPIDKYNIKFTYSSSSPKAISFASTPEEGSEYIISILNNTSADISQPIPNSTGWQSASTSVSCPAGKVTEISIRYAFGKYIVRT